jgi:hypothetical protein
LKSPEKVGHAERTEQKDAGSEWYPESANGAGSPRQLSDTKKTTSASNQITHSSA